MADAQPTTNIIQFPKVRRYRGPKPGRKTILAHTQDDLALIVEWALHLQKTSDHLVEFANRMNERLVGKPVRKI